MTRLPWLAAGAALLFLFSARCAEERTPTQTATATASAPASAAASTRPQIEELESPAGPGALGSFVFTTRDGVGLSWMESLPNTDRTALRVAMHRDGKWTEARTVVERNDLFVNWADFPSVIEDAKGTLFAHWLQKSGNSTYAYDVQMASSKDGGATWSKPFLLNRDGKQSEHGFVSLVALPDGGVGAAWLDGRHMNAGAGHDSHDAGDMSIRYANVDANGSLTKDTELDGRTCECCTTGMTLTSSGPVIVYRDRSKDEIRDISFVRRDGEQWTKPQPLRNDGWKINGCPVNGPQIDSIGPNVATAWFTGANGQQHVYFAFSRDGGATFGEAIAVDDGKPVGRVDVVMLDESTALVTWLEQTEAAAEIRARRVPLGGKAEASMKIADATSSRAGGFTRIARHGSDVWFTWTEGSTPKKVHVGRGRF